MASLIFKFLAGLPLGLLQAWAFSPAGSPTPCRPPIGGACAPISSRPSARRGRASGGERRRDRQAGARAALDAAAPQAEMVAKVVQVSGWEHVEAAEAAAAASCSSRRTWAASRSPPSISPPQADHGALPGARRPCCNRSSTPGAAAATCTCPRRRGRRAPADQGPAGRRGGRHAARPGARQRRRRLAALLRPAGLHHDPGRPALRSGRRHRSSPGPSACPAAGLPPAPAPGADALDGDTEARAAAINREMEAQIRENRPSTCGATTATSARPAHRPHLQPGNPP
jgi:hypothetical protein